MAQRDWLAQPLRSNAFAGAPMGGEGWRSQTTALSIHSTPQTTARFGVESDGARRAAGESLGALSTLLKYNHKRRRQPGTAYYVVRARVRSRGSSPDASMYSNVMASLFSPGVQMARRVRFGSLNHSEGTVGVVSKVMASLFSLGKADGAARKDWLALFCSTLLTTLDH